VRPEDLTLEGCWDNFAKVCIPEGAPEIQHQAMRQAFLAGCSTVLELESHSRSKPLPHQRRLLDEWDQAVQEAIKGQAKPQ
jgi:hypothetical protein